jgi:hypothetical protein
MLDHSASEGGEPPVVSIVHGFLIEIRPVLVSRAIVWT